MLQFPLDGLEDDRGLPVLYDEQGRAGLPLFTDPEQARQFLATVGIYRDTRPLAIRTPAALCSHLDRFDAFVRLVVAYDDATLTRYSLYERAPLYAGLAYLIAHPGAIRERS